MLEVERRLGDQGSLCRVSFTERADQDGANEVRVPRSAGEITRLEQCHGAEVIHVDTPGAQDGAAGDAAWTSARGAVLQVRTADCVPIAMYGTRTPVGAVAAIHAGWRGLLAGVVQECAAAMTAAGCAGLRAIVGAYIHPANYEFGPAELKQIAARYGDEVRSKTAAGAAALDLGATARRALAECGVRLDFDLHRCTAANLQLYFSHRSRRQTERMAMNVELLCEVGRR